MIRLQDVDPLSLPSVAVEDRKQLPETPAIYFAIDGNNQIQYIGKSRFLKSRWKNHSHSQRLARAGVVTISFLEVDAELLDVVEAGFIDTLCPPINSKNWRKAKSIRPDSFT